VIDVSAPTDLDLRWSVTVDLEMSVRSTEVIKWRKSRHTYKELVVLAEAPILCAYVEIPRWHSCREARKS
jgi:hypothetical protein